QKLVECLERIKIGLLGILGARENAADSARNLLQNMQRIGDEDGADGCPTDGDQFRRLNENAQVPVLHQIAGHYTAKNHDDADDRKHKSSQLLSVAIDCQRLPWREPTTQLARR